MPKPKSKSTTSFDFSNRDKKLKEAEKRYKARRFAEEYNNAVDKSNSIRNSASKNKAPSSKDIADYNRSVNSLQNFYDEKTLKKYYNNTDLTNIRNNMDRMQNVSYRRQYYSAPKPTTTTASNERTSLEQDKKKERKNLLKSYFQTAVDLLGSPAGLQGSGVSTYTGGVSTEGVEQRVQAQKNLVDINNKLELNYAETIKNPDFKAKAKADEATAKKDNAYKYINSNKAQRDAFKAAAVRGGGTTGNVQLYDKMTAEQISIYNYLYKTEGKKAANEYLDVLAGGETGIKAYSDVESQYKQFTSKRTGMPLVMEAVRLGSQIAEGIGGIMSNVASMTGNEQMANKFRQPSIASGAINRQITEDINDWSKDKVMSGHLEVGGHDFGNIYTIGYNALDSYVRAAISGKVLGGSATAAFNTSKTGSRAIQALVNAPISMSAYGDSYYQARKSGKSDNEAKKDAFIDSAIEWTSEMLGGLFGFELKGGGAISQASNEGFEEITGNILQRLYDVLGSAFNGRESELEQEYTTLINNGMSAKDAIKSLFSKYAAEDVISYASAFLPMAIGGGGQSGMQRIMQRINDTKIGKDIQSGQSQITDLPTLVNVASSLGTESTAYKTLEKSVLNNKNVSDATVGQLYRETLSDVQKQLNDASDIKELTNTMRTVSEAIDASNPQGANVDEFTVTVARMFKSAADNLTATENKAQLKQAKAEAKKTIVASETTTATATQTEKPKSASATNTVSAETQAIAPTKTSFKMPVTANGNSSMLTSVESVSGDEGITFKTATGDSVKFTDVEFGDAYTDKVVSDAIEPFNDVTMGKNGANEYIRIMTSVSGLSDAEYGRYSDIAKMLYNVGRFGGTWQNVLNDDRLKFAVDSLGVPFSKAMVEAGIDDKNLETEEVKKNEPETKTRAGETKGEFINETEDTELDVVGKVLASITNSKAYFGGMELNANGDFNLKTDEIRVSTTSSRGIATLGHEGIGEDMRKYNPEGYKLVSNALLQYEIERNGIAEATKTTKAYYNSYKKVQPNTTIEDAQAEKTNDMIGALLFGNENGQRAFAEWLATRGDSKLVNAFKDFVQRAIDVINKYLKTENMNSAEKAALTASKEDAERLSKLILEEMDKATKIKEELAEVGIGIDEKTQSMYKYSTRFTADSIVDTVELAGSMRNIEKSMRNAANNLGIAKEDIDDFIKDFIKKERDVVDIYRTIYGKGMSYEEAVQQTLGYTAESTNVIKKNSDYPTGTGEFSTCCTKRVAFTKLFDYLQEANPNTLFDAKDISILRHSLQEHGYTVACGLCFVEDQRQLNGEIAKAFIEDYKKSKESGENLWKYNAEGKRRDVNVTAAMLKRYKKTLSDAGITLKAGQKLYSSMDEYIPTQFDIVTERGFAKLKREHPIVAMSFEIYNNMRGQARGRMIEGRAEYNRQILTWGKKKVQTCWENGGFRIFSFSDFEAAHTLDLIQMVIDAQLKNVPIHMYTKQSNLAKLIEKTGIKLNRSFIPKGETGLNADNTLAFDGVEGIGDENSPFLSDNNDNQGNILIGVSDKQIRIAMRDSRINMVIPFHTTKAQGINELLGVGKWQAYGDIQNEISIKTGKATSNVNEYKEVLRPLLKEVGGDETKITERMYTEKFLDVCHQKGLVPRFSKFLETDGTYEDGTTRYVATAGYYKLLADFKLFDTTQLDEDGFSTRYLPQRAVTADFDTDVVKEIVKNDNQHINKTAEEIFAEKFYAENQSPEQAMESARKERDEIVKYLFDNREKSKEEIALEWAKGKKINLDFNNNYVPSLESSKLSIDVSDINDDYMQAAENGDEATAQKLVDDAAMRWGAYSEDGKKPTLLYHGTDAEPFTVFDFSKDRRQNAQMFFSTDRSIARGYSEAYGRKKTSHIMPVYVDTRNFLTVDANGDWWTGFEDTISKQAWNDKNDALYDKVVEAKDAYENARANYYEANGEKDANEKYALLDKLYLEYTEAQEKWKESSNYFVGYGTEEDYYQGTTYSVAKKAHEDGYDGVIIKNVVDTAKDDDETPSTVVVVFDANRIKSADPITYDNDGNVIPLSERFSESNDIRYSVDVGVEQIENKYENETNVLAIGETADRISIHNMVVKPEYRNKGVGQSILNDVVNYADRVGKTITLTPSSEYGTKARLTKWYKANGFVENKGRNADLRISDTMYRLPDKLRLSIDIDADDSSDFIKSRKSLQNTVDFYKEYVQYLGTLRASDAEIQKKAVALKRQYNSAMTVDEVKSQLNDIYTYLASGNVRYDEYRDMAMTLGKALVETENVKTNAVADDMLKKLKTVTVSITDEQRRNITKYYGNVASWLNTVRKGIKYSKEGTSLASQWDALCDMFPSVFDRETAEADMPLVLADTIRALTDTTTNEYGYDSNEMAEMFALDFLDEYMSKSNRTKMPDKATRESFISNKASNARRLTRIKTEAKNKQSQKFEDLKKTNRRLVTENVDLATRLAKQKGKMQEQKDTRERSMLRTRIRKNLNKILTMAATPTKDKHIPNSIVESVKALAEAVTLDDTQYDARLTDKLNRFRLGFLDDSIKKDSQYAIISELYNGYISEKIDELNSKYADTPLKELPATALREINDLIVMTGQSINNINRLFNKERNQTIKSYATSAREELAQHRKELTYKGTLKGYALDLLKPVYFFEYLGSNSLTDLYNDLRRGEDTWVLNYTKARDYMVDLRKKVGYNNWDFKEKQAFNTMDGDVNLTLQQRLAIYANSLGEHTRKNLLGGGITVNEKNTTIKEAVKNKGKARNKSGTYRLTEDDLNAIVATLSDEQLKYVKDMIKFMSTTCAEWGNEVTRQLYGIELYKEESYYPALVEGMFRFDKAKDDKNYKPSKELVNKSFSKAIIPEATNPLILNDFENTVSTHIIDMASYNAFVLPLENFDRVYNYSTVGEDNKWHATKEYIQDAFTKQATKYIDNLIEDINGGAMASTDYTNKFISLFKKGAVFASASVVVQQPSAIGRALAILDAKYFVGNPTEAFKRADYNEMLEYCPIARIKELGYFDTGMAQSAVDSLNAKEYERKEKVKAFFTDGSYRDEALSFMAAKADEITWTHIWNACKKEAADKYGNLSAEEQKQKASERFTEIITKTQVYDSVFSRAGVMRNKSTGMKMATAFMAEPLTSLNMLANAITQTKRGTMSKSTAAKTVGSLVLASVINALLQTLVTAARHGKDDDDWKELYLAELLPNFLDNLNPAKQIPILRDVISIFSGYDVTRADMSVFVDLEKAVENLQNDNKKTSEKLFGLAGALGNCLGLPIRNVYRDANAVVNIVKDMFDDYHFSDKNAQEKFKEEMNQLSTFTILNKTFGVEVFTTGTSSRYDKMFKAYEKGNTDKADKLLNEIRELESEKGKDEKEVNSAIKTKFTTKYKAEYLQADEKRRKEIVSYMTDSGAYGSRSDVVNYIGKYWKE